MTQMPPPPNYTTPYGYVPPRQTNAWAVVSLVTGLIGCLVITPVVAIVTGIIGVSRSRRLGNGRGMSIAGIALGLVWLVVLGGMLALGVFGYGKFKDLNTRAKPQTIALINRVQQGNTTPDATSGQLTAEQLQQIGDEAKGLGMCQGINTTGLNLNNTNGQVTGTLDGTATFEHGQKQVHAKMHMVPVNGQLTWEFEELELK